LTFGGNPGKVPVYGELAAVGSGITLAETPSLTPSRFRRPARRRTTGG